MALLNMTMVSALVVSLLSTFIQRRGLGTPATTSQMAKDVTTFLSWAAEPEHDERKKIGIKAVILFSTLTALSIYVKRFKWAVIKNRKIGELHSVLVMSEPIFS